MLRLCALSCDAENCDLKDTSEPNPFARARPKETPDISANQTGKALACQELVLHQMIPYGSV